MAFIKAFANTTGSTLSFGFDGFILVSIFKTTSSLPDFFTRSNTDFKVGILVPSIDRSKFQCAKTVCDKRHIPATNVAVSAAPSGAINSQLSPTLRATAGTQ